MDEDIRRRLDLVDGIQRSIHVNPLVALFRLAKFA